MTRLVQAIGVTVSAAAMVLGMATAASADEGAKKFDTEAACNADRQVAMHYGLHVSTCWREWSGSWKGPEAAGRYYWWYQWWT